MWWVRTYWCPEWANPFFDPTADMVIRSFSLVVNPSNVVSKQASLGTRDPLKKSFHKENISEVFLSRHTEEKSSWSRIKFVTSLGLSDLKYGEIEIWVETFWQHSFVTRQKHCLNRVWVGNLKQRVPITSKSSKFKGATQHSSKIAKISGCQTLLSKNLAGARHPWHP